MYTSPPFPLHMFTINKKSGLNATFFVVSVLHLRTQNINNCIFASEAAV